MMVGKKDGFLVEVVGRDVVVRGIDNVVEVVDDVPVVVRGEVIVMSGILGTLKGRRVVGGVCTMFDPFTKEDIEGFTKRYASSSSSL
ncbi:MAG: hypothetical protein ACK56F_25000 [bacterium]